jgi:hypothetical protein
MIKQLTYMANANHRQSVSLPKFLPTVSGQVAEVRAIGQRQATDRAIASGKVVPLKGSK